MMDLFLTIGAAVVAVLVYLNTLDGEFVFDDLVIAGALRHAKQTRTIEMARFWTRPILYWTYARNAVRHGFTSRSWHVTNIAVHAVNTVLVYAILRNWFPILPAWIGAIGFAVYPLADASVASIAGRSSCLAGTFYLGSVLSLLCGSWVLALLLMFIGFYVREDSVLFVPSLAVIWWYR